MSQIKKTLRISDINTTVNHEPRISHVTLAKALGYSSPTKLRELIERHMDGLRHFTEVSPTVGETSKSGGRPSTVYWLTKKQCLYVCTKANTENATEVTIQMVEVFDAVTQGKQVEIGTQYSLPVEVPEGCMVVKPYIRRKAIIKRQTTIDDVLALLEKPENWRQKDMQRNCALAALAIKNLIENIKDNHGLLKMISKIDEVIEDKGTHAPHSGVHDKFYILEVVK